MHAVHTARGRRRPRGRWVLPFVVAGAAVLAAAPASAVVQHDALQAQRYADVDVRTGSVAPTTEQQEIARRLGARVRWNELGAPQSLIRDDGFLATGVQGQDAEAAAREFVGANLALFRLSSLDTLELVNDADLTGGGHAVAFGQEFDGRPSAPEGTLTIGLARAADGWQVAYASSTLSGDETMAAARSAQMSAAEAWTAAARAVGVNASVAQLRSQSRRAGWTRLNVSGAPDGLVREVAFPTADRGAVPAFETYVERSAGESYRQVVDASSGDVLFREGATDHAVDDPHWKVFPAYPRSGLDRFPWNYPSSDIRDVWCWTGEGDAPERCDMEVADSAPRPDVEWDTDARTNQPTFTTIGNNARAGENWQSSSEPQPVQYRPTSTTRDYLYPWDNVWYEDRCDPSNFTPSGNDIDSAATNLHVMHNRMHDWAYHLGFTEATWNAQDHNFGVRPEGENDGLLGNVQAGGVTGGAPTYSGRDNANMSTRPDGTPSRTNMYLWQPIAGTFYAPCVDGDFDMSVIAHEYGHMIENRMIGKGNRRAGFHAGAMGESAGDLMAMEYVSEWDFARTAGEDPTLVGRYVTGNDEHGIRNYDMDFVTAGEFPEPGEYPEVDPLNFGDVGYDFTGPQVHADGEIWSATNYDIRELFTQRYGSGSTRLQRECASGQRPATQCPGNRRWMQIMFDSFLLMPVGPTFLDARDAQLAADRIRFGGANQDLLWRAFARRGFGEQAFTAGTEDSEPTPDFSSPMEGEETVRFEAVAKDEGRRPVSARIYVGHYEARVSPIADTDPATAGANLDDVARFVADDGGRERTTGQRGYEFVAHAPGYGHVRFRLRTSTRATHGPCGSSSRPTGRRSTRGRRPRVTARSTRS